jgi:hypothetical protein
LVFQNKKIKGKNINNRLYITKDMTETVTIPKEEYLRLKKLKIEEKYNKYLK